MQGSKRTSYKKLLGKELWGLVQDQKLPLTGVTPLTTLPSNNSRAAYRLHFARHRSLKARRFPSVKAAKRFEALSTRLASLPFSRLVARKGASVLLEWVPGKPLRPRATTKRLLLTCGQLHGRLHRLPLPESWPMPKPLSKRQLIGTLQNNLVELLDAQALSRSEIKQALSLGSYYLPHNQQTGFVHWDFCAENVVLDRQGHPKLIDNETLAVGVLDHDLARTWYRWPMDTQQREAYFKGYTKVRDIGGFEQAFFYWIVLVLAQSALFRLRSNTPKADWPVLRLKRLLRRSKHWTHPTMYDV